MLSFCTLFDKNYLSRGIVLWESLKKHCDDFNLYILCLDDFTYDFFQTAHYGNQLIPIPLSALEAFDIDLNLAKSNRRLIEYYFTLSPVFPLYLLKKNSHLEWICALDADILFYSNPKQLFEKFDDNYSILITPHKFTDILIASGSEKYGKFNVSFQAFKNNAIGLQCLEQWRIQCLEWCDDYYDEENNRFADQKYLDNWPIEYKDSIMILDDEVSGLAVWNVDKYPLNYKKDRLYSNNKPVIFYHFHGLQFVYNNWIINHFYAYNVTKNSRTLKRIYKAYINLILIKHDELKFKNDNIIRKKHRTLWIKILEDRTPFYYFRSKYLWPINLKFIHKIYLNCYLIYRKLFK
jgi:hypothetical protein